MKKRVGIRTLAYTNKPLLILSIFFVVVGLFAILSASSITSELRYGTGTPYYFFIKQLIFVGAATLISSIIVMFIDTKHYPILSTIAALFFTIVLFITIIVNSTIDTSVSTVTLPIGNMTFQPAELLKVFYVMVIGCWLSRFKDHKRYYVAYLIVGALCIIATLTVMFGGDFGSAIIMGVLYALTFMIIPTKDKWANRLKIIFTVGLVFCFLLLKFGYIVIPENILKSDYRLNRFIYQSPCDRYESNSGYQVCNGFIAINNGGIKGEGLGESTQKYLYLPESHTDFIFPIVVEETGIIFGSLLIIGFMAVAFFIFKVAVNSYTLQNSVICYGIGIYFLLHVFVNLGGVLGVIPLTGVPLPFLSYGGTYCVTLLCSLAVVQRINVENEITKRNNRIKASK